MTITFWINYLDPATLGLNRTPTLLKAPDTSWKLLCGSKDRRSPQWEEKATALLAYLRYLELNVYSDRTSVWERDTHTERKERMREIEWEKEAQKVLNKRVRWRDDWSVTKTMNNSEKKENRSIRDIIVWRWKHCRMKSNLSPRTNRSRVLEVPREQCISTFCLDWTTTCQI